MVVTAQKRTSTVQDTPISITALTGNEIQSRGFTDFTALAESVPGISMKTSGPGQTEFELRGLTSSGGNSPTVGFYLDDTPLSAPANAQNGKVVIDPNLYDLNRVEVLRGPQGTLCGAGSMGGTIKVVTNAPDPSAFDVSSQLILSGTDGGGFNHAENGMINLPFGGGNLALRIVGSFDHQSGWIDRIVTAAPDFPLETNGNMTRGNVLAAPVAADHKRVNSEDLSGVRAALLWKPTDRLSVTPTFFSQKITQDGLSDFDSDPGTLASYQPFDIPEPYTDRFDLGTLNVQYHFDAADVASQTSYWTRDSEVRQDGSEELQQVLSAALQPFGCPFPLPFYTNEPCGLGPTTPTPFEDDRSSQITEELNPWFLSLLSVLATALERCAAVRGLTLRFQFFDEYRERGHLWQRTRAECDPFTRLGPFRERRLHARTVHCEQRAARGCAANGLAVQDVPKWTSAASLAYSHPITHGLDFTARFDSTYTASRTQVTNALQTLPNYSLSSLRVGVDGSGWTATVFASNVFDKVAWLSYAYQINVGIPTFRRVSMAPPRTVGVEFTYRLDH